MINYVHNVYMDSTTTYPTGENFDRIVVLQDATFSAFSANWKVGNTEVEVTATEIDTVTAGQVLPGTIKNVALLSGKILLCRD